MRGMNGAASKAIKIVCGKCEGRGKLAWTQVDHGRCFDCGGTGALLVDESEVAAHWPSREEAIDAISNVLALVEDSKDLTEDWGSAGADLGLRAAGVLAQAPTDVVARGLVAFERALRAQYLPALQASVDWLRREAERQRAAYVAGYRTVHRNLRKVG